MPEQPSNHPLDDAALAELDNSPGPVFIVLTTNDKQGTLEPDIIGPFDSMVQAARFGIEQCGEVVSEWPPRSGRLMPGGFRHPGDEGGYAGVIYVSASTTTWTPEDYAALHIYDEEEESF